MNEFRIIQLLFSKRITIFCLLLPLFFNSLQATPTDNAEDTWQNLTAAQIAKLLDWQATPNADSLCGGFYRDLAISTPVGTTKKQTLGHGDSAILRQNKPNELIGNVHITQVGRQVTGDRATSYPDKTGNKIETVDVRGNVHLREPGMLAVGSKAKVNLMTKAAVLDHATFRFQIPAQPRTVVYDAQHKIKEIHIEGSNYRGNAASIHQDKPKHVTFHWVSMTTCNPFSNAWKLQSSTLKLNDDTGMGTAYNAILFIHHIPVFYTPYISFPITNKRKSGFLMPNFGLSDIDGTSLSTPYYWNMAPNYDMTITPNFMRKRGVLTSSLFRYLDTKGAGQAYFSFIPDDKVFAQLKQNVTDGSKPVASPNLKNNLLSSSNDRYEFGWQDNTQYSPYLQSAVDIDYVNDAEFLLDFPSAPLRAGTEFSNILPTTQLQQSVNVTYATNHWSVNSEFENFQTLHPISLPEAPDQYARVPDIDAIGIYPNILPDVNLTIDTEASHFVHPLFQRDYQTLLTVTGYRYNFSPSVDLYLAKAWGYIDPRITATQTFYDLQNPIINAANPNLSQKPSMQRNVPIFDIDSGLYFDRNISFDKTSFIQTLEPRLFYLYSPFVQQDDFPNFDSSLNPASTFDQLFNINRFQGFDRYGDANQITLALTSRFINSATGSDVVDLDIGQIVYFQNRQVTVPGPNGQPPSTNQLAQNKDSVSPLVGQVNWQFMNHWTLTGNLAYDTLRNDLKNSNSSLIYSTGKNQYLSAGFTYLKDGETEGNNTVDLEQINLGLVWPIGVHWHTIGGVVYNISRQFPQTYIYGLQYNNCCWAVRLLNSKRFIGFKSANGTDPLYDPGIFLQFVLTGLTSQGIGQGNGSPGTLMQYALPGYNDTFGANPLLQPSA